MTMRDLLDECAKREVSVSVVDGNLRVRANKDALTPELVDRLKAHKEELLAFLSSFHDTACIEDSALAIPIADRHGELLLSFAQQRLWFVDQLEQGGSEYHLPLRFDLKGRLDATALRRALQGVVDRHEVLRTSIVGDDGQREP